MNEGPGKNMGKNNWHSARPSPKEWGNFQAGAF